ncbi:response regulator [Frigidibacter sp. MR17.14]|uniref:response regulator n=1 Tax=Frigidibacter sp. MR17.14 TaxID=3126509 RepID=UPI00301305F9
MRILYLEDEAIIALETTEILRDIGFEDVRVAYSLDGVEKALQGDLPDVALLDINLGHGRTSFELGRSLVGSGVTVVYATGYSASSLPGDLNAMVIEKPLSAAMLEDALRTALGAEDERRVTGAAH